MEGVAIDNEGLDMEDSKNVLRGSDGRQMVELRL